MVMRHGKEGLSNLGSWYMKVLWDNGNETWEPVPVMRHMMQMKRPYNSLMFMIGSGLKVTRNMPFI